MSELCVDEVRWTLDDPEPASCHVAEDIDPPQGLTASRADLVAWWRWRYATLDRERAQLADLFVQALGEAQSYRTLTHAALDTVYHVTDTTDRQRRTITRLRDEYRRFRERVMR